ncbi:MAG: sodium:calcium antiporter, partial [Proteobacteria bacterium]|nr:sodium:calcium antiporter [Pseudomonadota bacterium]
MVAFFQLLGGLVLLVYAGDALIRGSVSMARRLNVSPLIIGLTIVAFGTSVPELVVGIDAVLTKVPTLALGNVVGSNIANIWLVLGLPAVIAPMLCRAHRLSHNMVAMLLATVGFIAMAFTGEFTAVKGMVLLAGLLIILFFLAKLDKKSTSYQEVLGEMEGFPKKPDSFRFSALIILAGLVGLGIGAHFFVAGAVDFARMMGVTEAVIG